MHGIEWRPRGPRDPQVGRQLAPTPAVKQVEPMRSVGSGPADCSIVRKMEVALQGGVIGTC